MINDHITLQSNLIYFGKTRYIVYNLKMKNKHSPPKPSIQKHPKSDPLKKKLRVNSF